jgi:hypothetical protein
MILLTPLTAPHNEDPLIIGQQLNDQPGGYKTVTLQDGCVMSVQPDGTVEHRAPGSAGAYEVASLVGSMLSYSPDGASAYQFGYVDQIPNAQPTTPPVGEPPEQHHRKHDDKAGA